MGPSRPWWGPRFDMQHGSSFSTFPNQFWLGVCVTTEKVIKEVYLKSTYLRDHRVGYNLSHFPSPLPLHSSTPLALPPLALSVIDSGANARASESKGREAGYSATLWTPRYGIPFQINSLARARALSLSLSLARSLARSLSLSFSLSLSLARSLSLYSVLDFSWASEP